MSASIQVLPAELTTKIGSYLSRSDILALRLVSKNSYANLLQSTTINASAHGLEKLRYITSDPLLERKPRAIVIRITGVIGESDDCDQGCEEESFPPFGNPENDTRRRARAAKEIAPEVSKFKTLSGLMCIHLSQLPNLKDITLEPNARDDGDHPVLTEALFGVFCRRLADSIPGLNPKLSPGLSPNTNSIALHFSIWGPPAFREAVSFGPGKFEVLFPEALKRALKTRTLHPGRIVDAPDDLLRAVNAAPIHTLILDRARVFELSAYGDDIPSLVGTVNRLRYPMLSRLVVLSGEDQNDRTQEVQVNGPKLTRLILGQQSRAVCRNCISWGPLMDILGNHASTVAELEIGDLKYKSHHWVEFFTILGEMPKLEMLTIEGLGYQVNCH
ncbi:hypothetical protein BCR34DRAFT_617765 [Clohesyomyces aquaticus]|uniref:F-box domain-containing protein n=1 Tax=Clohesyomyces aquaticus TaxID=1231657 RepID=A0A1Y1Z180_9PLEO|nr:hypothetical protein BCR34DRAFT_617765 [Clohesyomyces aquaticus]